MTDAYQPNDPLTRTNRVPSEAEAVIGAPTVPTAGGTTGTPSSGTQSSGVKDTAKEEAGKVKDTAADAGRHVASTTKEEAKKVGSEAKQQARNLLDTSVQELKGQAKSQQDRAAGGVRTFSDELRKMASGEGAGSGFAAQIVNEVSDRASSAAQWIEAREPADLLEEVKRFARRRPGTFIAIAGVAGLLVGRLARGIASEVKDERDQQQLGTTGTYGAYGTTGVYSTDTYGTETYGADTYGTGTAGTYGTGTGTTGAYGTPAGDVYGTGLETDTVAEEPWTGERPAGLGTPQAGDLADPSRREDGL